MPSQPTSTQLHVDRRLTSISIAYIQDLEGFVHDKATPTVYVPRKTDKLVTFDKDDWLRARADVYEGGPGAKMNILSFGVTDTTFSCVHYENAFAINLDDMNNADEIIETEQSAAELLAQDMRMTAELDWVTKMFTTSIWGTDNTLSGTDQWSDYANSDPIGDVDTAVQAILTASGKMANTIVMDYATFRNLKRHPAIIDLLKYSGTGQAKNVTAQILAEIFDVERVLVARAINETGVEGETSSVSFIAGDACLVMYVPSVPRKKTPASSYRFVHEGLVGRRQMATRRFYVDQDQATYIECNASWDQKVTAASMGYFINDTLA